MNINSLSTQLLFTTVPLWTRNPSGQTGTATAFFYSAQTDDGGDSTIPFLITCYHAIENASDAVIELIESNGEEPATDKKIRAGINVDDFRKYGDKDLDIAAVPIGPLLNAIQKDKKTIFYRSIVPNLFPNTEVVADFSAMEDIVFIGYPSGLRDEKNSMPLIRRGITSTPIWNDFQGKPFFLVDANVFPGSSGSPVFILNEGTYATKTGIAVGSRLHFVGIISQTMTQTRDHVPSFLQLGKVLNCLAVERFIQPIVDKLKSLK